MGVCVSVMRSKRNEAIREHTIYNALYGKRFWSILPIWNYGELGVYEAFEFEF